MSAPADAPTAADDDELIVRRGIPTPLRGWAPKTKPRHTTRWPLVAQASMIHENPDDNGCIRLQRLGEGAFGIVYKVLNVQDQLVYGLKDITAPTDVANVLYERALVHKTLMSGNDHLVRYYDVYWRENPEPGLSRFSITMDYCSEGDLTKYLKHTELTENFIVRMTLQVLDGLLYMNALDPQYYHMDIKPENILVFGKGDLFKLCDFDACRCADQDEMFTFGQDTTEEYKAPEIENLHFTAACDVFSLGVVLYLISALPEFPVIDGKMLNHPSFADHDVLEGALRGIIGDKAYLARGRRGKDVTLELRSYTPQFIDMVTRMVMHDFDKRPSVQTCHDHFLAHFDQLRRGVLKPKSEKLS